MIVKEIKLTHSTRIFNNNREHFHENKISIPGPDGLLEGKLHISEKKAAPVVLVLHPHPLHGGTMNNKVVHTLSRSFQKQEFNTLRINFRGVGESQGKSVGGDEELEDALTALDWFIKKREMRQRDSIPIWVAGFSFGGWVAMQAAMRRPEITGFVAISPPVETYHFNMLTPCPNGLIIQGTNDHIVSAAAVEEFSNQLIRQKGCEVKYTSIEADHYFTGKLQELGHEVTLFIEDHTLNE